MSTEDKTTDPLLEILAKVRSIDTRLASVESRLDSLETKVDERLRETRPIWEQALKENMDTRLELGTKIAAVEREQRMTNHKLENIAIDIVNVRADLRDFNKRIEHLEQETPTEQVK